MRTDRPTAIDELVPLADRRRYLQVTRLLLLGAVLAYLAAVPEARTVSSTHAQWALAAYAGVILVGHLVWRVRRSRNMLLFGLLLLADGIFLTWSAAVTGGSAGPLRYLLLVHLVTVALLASYRTATKVGLWHSLLAIGHMYAVRADLLPGPAQVAEVGTDYEQLVVFLSQMWAAAVATAAFAAVNERELRRRKVDLEFLARLATSLERVTTSEGVVGELEANLTAAFDFPRVAVLTMEHPALRTTDAVVAAVFGEHATRLVARLDPASDPGLAGLLGGGRNLVVTPMFAEGNPIGVIVAEHGLRQGSRIARRVVGMVERFAAHGALALRNATLLEELRRSASTDPLTGLANRGTLETSLARELARSDRTGEPLSVVMVDVDHFKSLNDEFGHQQGDAVLRAVAAALASNVRAGDLVGRYGGEEFAVLLPDCPLEQAVASAERLRQAVERLQVVRTVTASFGVAVYPADAAGPDRLVGAADEALYAAKKRGRNRVVSASKPVRA